MPRLLSNTHVTRALMVAMTVLFVGCEHDASRDQAETRTALRAADDAIFTAGSDQTKLERAIGDP